MESVTFASNFQFLPPVDVTFRQTNMVINTIGGSLLFS